MELVVNNLMEWNVSDSPLLAALLIHLGNEDSKRIEKAKEILKLYLDKDDPRIKLLDSL